MKRFFLLLLMMTLLTPCIVCADSSQYDLTFSNRELESTWEKSGAVTITGQGESCDISGKGASLSDHTLTIKSEGVYVFSGDFTNLSIVVAAGSKAKVQLVLNGASITAINAPALHVKTAKKVFLTVAEGTENIMTDGTDSDRPNSDTSLDAVIFSRADLCINGNGKLTVQGSYKHGVVSKDDLILVGTTLDVSSVSTALDGKDCVMMQGVTANITAGSNGVRSNNEEDKGRGFVYIASSTLTIKAGGDGIDAATLLRADNGVLTITTGEGSGEVRSSEDGFDFRGGRGGKGDRGVFSLDEAADSRSMKALKAGQDIEINGGAYVIDSQDDCIHANEDVTINDGQFTLKSGDDGIHADTNLLVSGGDIEIQQCSEGLEASSLTISGGRLDITASDDGLNAAGGVDDAEGESRPGRDKFSRNTGDIVISGGYIHINAGGDGIDSNNTITISGGVTLITSPARSMNSAFDYNGEATITGGTLIATGGSGMAQSFSKAENQGCMLFGVNDATGGTNLAIVTAEGQVVASFTPAHDYSAVVVTAPDLQVGSTYSVVIGADVDGADEHGFASRADCSGGVNIGSIEMTEMIQGGSGHNIGGGRGGRRER